MFISNDIAGMTTLAAIHLYPHVQLTPGTCVKRRMTESKTQRRTTPNHSAAGAPRQIIEFRYSIKIMI